MSEPELRPEKHTGVWKVLRIVLPLLFLACGFFGVQIWLEMEEADRVAAETPVTAEQAFFGAKTDVAAIAKGETPEKPVAPAKPTENASAEEQLRSAELPGFDYYSLQVGSFSQASGAEKLKEKLKEMGYGCAFVQEPDRVRVVVMALFTREQAAEMKVELEEREISAFADKMTVARKVWILKKQSSRLAELLAVDGPRMRQNLEDLAERYYKYENSEFVAEDHDRALMEALSELTDLRTRVQNLTVDPTDAFLQKSLLEYLDAHLQYLEKARKVTRYDRVVLWPGLVDLIVRYDKMNSED